MSGDVQCQVCAAWGYIAAGYEIPDGWQIIKQVLHHELRTFYYCPKHDLEPVDVSQVD